MATIVPVSAKAAPAPAAPATPSVVVDIEATVKAEVAKAVAALKAEETKVETSVTSFVKTYWPHVAAGAAGYAASAFGVIEKLWKFI